jgi:hypothetical protein
MKAPQSFNPNPPFLLGTAFASFKTSQDEVRRFLCDYADLDLAGIGFPNPFLRGV